MNVNTAQPEAGRARLTAAELQRRRNADGDIFEFPEAAFRAHVPDGEPAFVGQKDARPGSAPGRAESGGHQRDGRGYSLDNPAERLSIG